jgi:uncharacterized protein YcfJ
MQGLGRLVLIVVGLALAGCTETTSGSSSSASTKPSSSVALSSSSQKTAAEKKLEAEAKSLNQVTNNIIVRNTVEGAVVGALAGCGIALLLGGDGDDCASGAVVGGLAGGVAGNQVGRAAAAKNVELVKRDQILANLRGVSTRLNSVEANLRSVVKAQNAEITSLNRQLAAGQISKSSYNARVNSINSNRRAVDSALASSERNIVKTRNEIKSAQRQGQQGLGSVDSAAASTQDRLARNRKLLALVN